MKSKEEKRRQAAADKSNLPSCHVCRQNISSSTAVTSEGKDYIWHFCSKDCHTTWTKNKSKYDE